MTREVPPISPQRIGTSHLKSLDKNDHDIWGWKSPLSPLDIDFYFDTQSISIINYLCLFQLTQSKETQGDKNRHVLRKLYNIDDSDFDRFLDHLKTTQPKVSERINNVKAQVHVNRRSSETTSEDDFGNDFDPGMFLNLSHLSLLKFLILT